LQVCVSARKGQTWPPCIGVFSIFERVRVWLPLPQERVHDVHVDQMLTEQSTGHGPLVQVCDWRVLPHATPPLAASAVMVRVLTWVPVAQDWLHWFQSDQEE
jgi:hypothetical protein